MTINRNCPLCGEKHAQVSRVQPWLVECLRCGVATPAVCAGCGGALIEGEGGRCAPCVDQQELRIARALQREIEGRVREREEAREWT